MARNILAIQLACLMVIAIGVANGDEPEKLVGADFAAAGEFPYTVNLRSNGFFVCGGAIISPRHILTAGHCLDKYLNNPRSLVVVTGSNFLPSGGEAYDVQAVYNHPFFRRDFCGVSWYYDVGVVKLTRNITFNRYQYNVALPTREPPAHSRAVVSAWGKSVANLTSPMSMYLKKLDVYIVEQKKCQKSHNVPIHPVMLCTHAAANRGTCWGDSGSPLVQSGEIVGLVSGGKPCAKGAPDIFTNVHYVLDFIYEALTY